MPEKLRMEIFIDYPNIKTTAYGVRLQSGTTVNIPNIDFQKLRDIIVGSNFNLVGSNLYIETKPGRDKFIASLEKSAFNVVGVRPQKSVDGRLIFDVIKGAYDNRYDVAAILSGDGDYISVVQEIKQRNKKVWIVAFGHATNNGLKTLADNFLDLRDVRTEISRDFNTH